MSTAPAASLVRGLDETAFWERVDRSGGAEACWPWTGELNATGYGQCYVPALKRVRSAHRLAYEFAHGPVPAGLVVDHVCHNESDCNAGDDCAHRACCNPAHLEAVTNAVNTLRGKSFAAENARKTHCPKGHPFDETNFYYRREGRRCKTCTLEREKERYDRLKHLPTKAQIEMLAEAARNSNRTVLVTPSGVRAAKQLEARGHGNYYRRPARFVINDAGIEANDAQS